MKNTKTTSQKEENRWIDIHNDEVMREMGLYRPYLQVPRDKSVWSKTPNERRIAKTIRHSHKGRDMHFHTKPAKSVRVLCNLIIYLKRNKIYPKTTYSIKCWQSDIQDILSRYIVTSKSKGTENIVAKYSWNGRTYNFGELPF